MHRQNAAGVWVTPSICPATRMMAADDPRVGTFADQKVLGFLLPATTLST